MKQIHYALFFAGSISLCLCNHACEPPTTTFLSIHSQGFNTMRMFIGMENHWALTTNSVYTSLSATPEYIKTFRPERIVQCLFGTDIIKCHNTITISGSQRTDRKPTDWLADYFGLPPDFQSCIRFEPHVEELLTDFVWHLSYKNIYAFIQTPLVRSKWNLDYCEDFCHSGTTPYPAGYSTPQEVPPSQLLAHATDFLSGENSPDFGTLRFEKLANAQMSPCPKEETSFADIHFFLGCFLSRGTYHHVGAHIRYTQPTGTQPTGALLFEPIVGNGHHKEFGAGINAHYQTDNPDNAYESVRLDAALDITHVGEAHQRRSFDLKNKPNSRYMLAQKMGTPLTDGLTGPAGSEPISAQFKQVYTPIANLTTCDISVKNTVQVDLSLLLSHVKEDAIFTFGYGVWARSKDNICLLEPCKLDGWALKGDAQLFGFSSADNTPVALSATDSEADIHAGTNTPSTINAFVDNPVDAYKNNVITLTNRPGEIDQIKTSLQPQLLENDALDRASGTTRGFAHKIAFNFNRMWKPSNHLAGSIGLGAEVELGNKHYTDCQHPETIINTALSHWGVWIKGSVTFK